MHASKAAVGFICHHQCVTAGQHRLRKELQECCSWLRSKRPLSRVAIEQLCACLTSSCHWLCQIWTIWLPCPAPVPASVGGTFVCCCCRDIMTMLVDSTAMSLGGCNCKSMFVDQMRIGVTPSELEDSVTPSEVKDSVMSAVSLLAESAVE